MRAQLFLFPLLLLPTGRAMALRCENRGAVENQAFPAVIELSPGERELKMKVLRKGSENAAVARDGHSYLANRVGKTEEARYGVPAYYVNDNAEGDRFAQDDRDTAVYLFAERSVLENKPGRIKLWLHYAGNEYRGVEENQYSCRVSE